MKKVNIYGTGINALKWVIDNKDVKINCFVETQKSTLEFLGYNVISAEENPKVLKENYTVVATTENVYWQIKKYLENELNLTEFENFEYMSTYKKKIAIVYGNCHANAVKSALIQVPVFNNVYGCYPLKPVYEINDTTELETQAIERCALFIHQSIRLNNVYGKEFASENLLKKLSSDCKIIAMPNLYRLPLFMFPQMTSYDEKIEHEGYNYFPFRDKFIDENYNKNSIFEIEKLIKDETLISQHQIKDGYNEFIEKVKTRECEWDIKILDFLVENMPKTQLFYDPSHPTTIVINYIVENILKILGIDFYTPIKYNCMDATEIPIYSSVFSAMNFEWNQTILRNINGLKLNDKVMDLREFIEQYIKWNFK